MDMGTCKEGFLCKINRRDILSPDIEIYEDGMDKIKGLVPMIGRKNIFNDMNDGVMI
jgi:hypothetical protein